jgi:hypothetical protein
VPDIIVPLIMEHLTFRKARENFAKREDATKKSLMEWLANEGEADEKGNRFFYIPEDDGNEIPIKAIKRERRVSQILDTDAAMALVKEKGLEAECIEMVPVLNEDALLAAAFGDKITDDEMKALYEDKESFAFILVKE